MESVEYELSPEIYEEFLTECEKIMNEAGFRSIDTLLERQMWKYAFAAMRVRVPGKGCREDNFLERRCRLGPKALDRLSVAIATLFEKYGMDKQVNEDGAAYNALRKTLHNVVCEQEASCSGH